jgi:hypothetical protein
MLRIAKISVNGHRKNALGSSEPDSVLSAIALVSSSVPVEISTSHLDARSCRNSDRDEIYGVLFSIGRNPAKPNLGALLCRKLNRNYPVRPCARCIELPPYTERKRKEICRHVVVGSVVVSDLGVQLRVTFA